MAEIEHTDWMYSSPAASIGFGKCMETRDAHQEENPGPGNYETRGNNIVPTQVR